MIRRSARFNGNRPLPLQKFYVNSLESLSHLNDNLHLTSQRG